MNRAKLAVVALKQTCERIHTSQRQSYSDWAPNRAQIWEDLDWQFEPESYVLSMHHECLWCSMINHVSSLMCNDESRVSMPHHELSRRIMSTHVRPWSLMLHHEYARCIMSTHDTSKWIEWVFQDHRGSPGTILKVLWHQMPFSRNCQEEHVAVVAVCNLVTKLYAWVFLYHFKS